jgi:hypothetical protein
MSAQALLARAAEHGHDDVVARRNIVHARTDGLDNTGWCLMAKHSGQRPRHVKFPRFGSITTTV